MQKLILDIFDKVSTRIPDLSEGEEELVEQVETILQALEVQVPQEFHDEIGRRFFEVSGISERKGFELGMKYMAKLIYECLS